MAARGAPAAPGTTEAPLVRGGKAVPNADAAPARVAAGGGSCRPGLDACGAPRLSDAIVAANSGLGSSSTGADIGAGAGTGGAADIIARAAPRVDVGPAAPRGACAGRGTG